MSQPMNITPEQAQHLGEEYRKLIELAQEQLVQHKLWLAGLLTTLEIADLTPEQHSQLVDEVHLIKLEMVRLEPAMKDGEKQTVSAVYEYPDALHAFLSRPGLPKSLSIPQQGGITLDVDAPSLKV